MALDAAVLKRARKPRRAGGEPPAGMSAEEWRTRVDLAAAYRLAVVYGWTDLNNTHFSARILGTENFLLNPFGMLFDEITASSMAMALSSWSRRRPFCHGHSALPSAGFARAILGWGGVSRGAVAPEARLYVAPSMRYT